MFREMRLKDQQLDAAEANEIMNRCTNGVLSINGDNGYPYGVPVSYAYADGRIYFHCAREGYKVDLLKKDPHVSFTVVAQDDIIPEDFNTLYISAIAFGRARLVDDPEEMRKIHGYIIDKYSKGHEESGGRYLDSSISEIYMVEITVDHITAKAGC
ncbi:MAG: pyridoxamine 5'-phosphate oxidase family protein [Clostridiales bacterium]|nr:pyridoxamine 5'-phosphate oxidase family protein [Clostridiales bacterium]